MKNAFREWNRQRLRHFRQAKDLKKEQVAELVKKNPKTYSAYEEGRSEPSLLTLKKLCSIFQVSMDEFMNGCPEADC